jgi:hypothetical protein
MTWETDTDDAFAALNDAAWSWLAMHAQDELDEDKPDSYDPQVFVDTFRVLEAAVQRCRDQLEMTRK